MSAVCRGQCAAGTCPFPLCIRTGQRKEVLAGRFVREDETLFEQLVARTPGARLGLAFDVGTTTVKGAVCDVESGQIVVLASRQNPQGSHGADVISRIEFTQTEPEGLLKLSRAVRSCLQMMAVDLLQLAGVAVRDIEACVVTGNTTMLHLAAGIDPASLGVYPYAPVTLFGQDMAPEVLGLALGCSVYVPPCVSAFVGADVICGLVGANLAAPGPPALLMDLGTNGELILRTESGWVCAAAAAGPVFEGGGISCGMPPVPGAVDKVWLADGCLNFSVLGGGAACGICASGLIQAVAAFLDLGLVEATGEVLEGTRLSIAPAVELTQKDVRAFQLAKAAIAAAAQTLVTWEGGPARSPREILLAGGFSEHLSVAAARRVGLVAAQPGVHAVGNAALAGAARLLAKPSEKKLAEDVSRRACAVDLAADPEFADRFSAALLLAPDSWSRTLT